VAEHRLPKPGVEGSNPFSRSITLKRAQRAQIIELKRALYKLNNELVVWYGKIFNEEEYLYTERRAVMNKHIITVVKPHLKRDKELINCRECATSCQSACKTSCTVGNQTCRNNK
jgi:predicted ribosomally synthesized six-cysteine peptide SCIFF